MHLSVIIYTLVYSCSMSHTLKQQVAEKTSYGHYGAVLVCT